MMHSLKYDYYKLPGGGTENGQFEDIFIQDNDYYLYEVEEEPVEQELDDYEEEGFVLEFVEFQYVIDVNEHANHKEKRGSDYF